MAGLIPKISGDYSLGNQITIGYFDQHSSEISSSKTVAEHFHDLFPSFTEKEVRSILGAYLFGGKEAGKRVDVLSGGEKARLVLMELLQSRPNFLILDEPTNHLDIHSKEILESALTPYTGTVLYVSHDRYFINKTATRILELSPKDGLHSYPGDYQHYLLEKEKEGTKEVQDAETESVSDTKLSWQKQKEKDAKRRKRENRLKKIEQEIEELEAENTKLDEEMCLPENAVNTKKLLELSTAKARNEEHLETLYEEWETLSEETE